MFMLATASSRVLFIDIEFGLEPSIGHWDDTLGKTGSDEEELVAVFSFCNAYKTKYNFCYKKQHE